jgi:hypothetical protein
MNSPRIVKFNIGQLKNPTILNVDTKPPAIWAAPAGFDRDDR